MRSFRPVAASAAVLTSAGLIAIAGASPASADHRWDHGFINSFNIKDQTLKSRDIAANGVGASEIRKNSVGWYGEINSYTRDLITSMVDAKADADHNHDDRYYTKEQSDERYLRKGDVPEPGPAPAAVTLNQHVSDKTQVANIGGNFSERATEVDSFELEPGTYQLSSDGFFSSTEATSGQTRLQLALRTDPAEGQKWGQDLGTCFTGAASVLANREATCSTHRIVSLDQATTVHVFAFGYADDQGSADSGKFSATSIVDVLSVG